MTTRLYQFLAICALCLAAAALGVTLWTSVLAQEEAPQTALAIPTTINYMGYLREPDGSLTTGTHDITASIYNIATGGDPLHTTTLEGVTVREGMFNIVLGDESPLPSSVFADAPLYIGISLDQEPELIPRQRLHAVPWAFQASTLINNAVAQTVQGLTSNGAVTVNGATVLNGNATVTGNLTVNGNLSRDDETFVGPHFLNPKVIVRNWGPCTEAHWWWPVSVPSVVPQGATAVILEYVMDSDWVDGDTYAWIAADRNQEKYMLGYVWGNSSTGGQGTYPIKVDGTNRTFEYSCDRGLRGLRIELIGYYK